MFGCFFGHVGRWGEPFKEEFTEVTTYCGQDVKGTERKVVITKQKRACERCGAIELRWVNREEWSLE